MPVSKEEHRKFYASMSKTQPLGLPSIKTRRHKSPQRRSPQRLSSMSPEPQSPGSLIAKANVMASWKPVLDFEMDNCDLDSRQLDGRDYFSLLGVTPEATAPEIDIAYNRVSQLNLCGVGAHVCAAAVPTRMGLFHNLQKSQARDRWQKGTERDW